MVFFLLEANVIANRVVRMAIAIWHIEIVRYGNLVWREIASPAEAGSQ